MPGSGIPGNGSYALVLGQDVLVYCLGTPATAHALAAGPGWHSASVVWIGGLTLKVQFDVGFEVLDKADVPCRVRLSPAVARLQATRLRIHKARSAHVRNRAVRAEMRARGYALAVEKANKPLLPSKTPHTTKE